MMYGKPKNESPEDEALEELKELITRIMVQNQTGEGMEKVENADEHLEEHGEIEDLGLEQAGEKVEEMMPEAEEEEYADESSPEMLHLAEVSVKKPNMADKAMMDEEKKKALKMVSAIRKAR